MNRDEHRSRHETGTLYRGYCNESNVNYVYPVDTASQGTWFGFNDQGIVIALLNRYQEPRIDTSRSRGEIIPWLLQSRSLPDIENKIISSDKSFYNPFDLLIINQENTKRVSWKQNEIKRYDYSTENQFFISSSAIQTEQTLLKRKLKFESFIRGANGDNISAHDILTGFHLAGDSKEPGVGVNMNRKEAHTKSINQLVISKKLRRLSYITENCLAEASNSDIISCALIEEL